MKVFTKLLLVATFVVSTLFIVSNADAGCLRCRRPVRTAVVRVLPPYERQPVRNLIRNKRPVRKVVVGVVRTVRVVKRAPIIRRIGVRCRN